MEVKVAFATGLLIIVFSMFGSSQDILDGVVYTEVKKTLAKGTTGILRCRFNRDPNAVYWKKGSDPENTPSIISWTYGIKSGPRYEDGSCDIDGNYSLVIRNVRNTDAGHYICKVSNYKGILIDNYTDVKITNSDDNTTVEPCTENCNHEDIIILLYVVSGFFIVSFVGFMIYCCRKYLRRKQYRSISSDTPSKPTKDDLTKGLISNVELWKLVVFSADDRENDKLSEAIRQLTADIPAEEYDKCNTDFLRLCRWKDNCSVTKQMDKLFDACSQAKMGGTVKKLKDFRKDVTGGVSDCDLGHILWQIGKKSPENITTLVSKLTKSRFNQDLSVSENVHRALPVLQEWTKENHAINPAVMLSLQSDDWCNEDMYFYTVSETDKRPLQEDDIKGHVRNVTKAHCQKIISIISTKDKPKRDEDTNAVDMILDENETDLFDAYQMITEWLDKQEFSNYEKRITLRKAVEDAKRASTSHEINLGDIERLASSKGNAEAAYDLLVKDIKPFATSLGLDESKLTKYSRLSSSSKSNRGTIGLVADVMAIKRKKYSKSDVSS